MVSRIVWLNAAVWLASNMWLAAASADSPTDGAKQTGDTAKYLRLERDSHEKAVALETAIVRFTPRTPGGKPVTIDLVGAVHIGDKAYYDTLNREFQNYDAVLYELVAREGTRIPKGGKKKTDNPISAIQTGMKQVLELEFQLDRIDYTRPNMVHADMSPEQFARSMRDRGEGIADMFLRLFAYALSKQGEGLGDSNEFDVIRALFDKNRALALKRIMAGEFQEMEGMMKALDGPNGSTLIGERNKRALEVLRQQMTAGKTKIAIFYGAGHMVDMQKRLADDFGMEPVSTRWLVAWDMHERARQSGGAREAAVPAK